MILIPIGNENSTVQRLPWVTFVIIALNVLVFALTWPSVLKSERQLQTQIAQIIEFISQRPSLLDDENLQKLSSAGVISREQAAVLQKSISRLPALTDVTAPNLPSSALDEEQSKLDSLIDEFQSIRHTHPFSGFGLIPAERSPMTFFSSMFLHAGFMHLLGNLLFFFAVGFTLEDNWGRGFFAGFYLTGGLAASLTHCLMFPNSTIPLVGASGAIAAVMGAFLVRFFSTRIKLFYWLFPLALIGRQPVGTFHIPAYAFLPLWFMEQLFYASLTRGSDSTGVAFWAHIGGFVIGATIALAVKVFDIEERVLKPRIEAKVEFGVQGRIRDALAALDRGASDEAEQLLRAQLQSDPTDVTAMLTLIQVCEQSGDAEKIRTAYAKSVEQHIDLGDKEAALFAYDNLLGTFHDEEPRLTLSPRHWMALCDYLVEREMFQEAAVEYRRIAAHHPNSPFATKALLNSGDLFLNKLNSPEEALVSYERGLALNPTQLAWLKRLQEGKTISTAMISASSAGSFLTVPPPIGGPEVSSTPRRPGDDSFLS